jgi:hypothetical protein
VSALLPFLLGVNNSTCPAAIDVALARDAGLSAEVEALSVSEAEALLDAVNPRRCVPWGSFTRVLLGEALRAHAA